MVPSIAMRQLLIIQKVICLSYLPTPPLMQDMTQGKIFKRSLTGLNSEFFLLLD